MALSVKGCFFNAGLKYICLVIWLCGSGILFWRTYYRYKYDAQFFYVHQILGSWLCVARGAAAVLNLNCALLLLPMCRTLHALARLLSRQVGFWTTRRILDAGKAFHIACGSIVVILSVLHVIAHVFNCVNFSRHYNPDIIDVNPAPSRDQNPALIALSTVPGVTGLLMLIVVVVLAASSLKCVREQQFNTFWYLHRLFFIFYALLIIHGYRGPIRRQLNVSEHFPGCNATDNSSIPFPEAEYIPEAEYGGNTMRCDEPPKFGYIGCESWLWLLVPLLLYLGDTVYRLFRRQPPADFKSVKEVSAGVVAVTLEKPGFKANPGQYVMVQVPDVSTLEWHPYTLLECPQPTKPSFTIWMKDNGDWSGKVTSLLSVKPTVSSLEEGESRSRRVHVDGPFSSPLEDVGKFRVSVCVAGGIGITPFLSHIKRLRHSCSAAGKLRRLYVFAISRDGALLQSCGAVFKDTHDALWGTKPDLLDIRFYHTGDHAASKLGDDTYVSKRLQFGRPSWNTILQEIADTHKHEKIGLFVCGPPSMNTSLKRLCMKQYPSTYYFHKESF